MNRTRWFPSMAALVAVLLAACASTSTPSASAPTNLEGSSWRLVQIAISEGVTRPAIERSRYTIGFGKGGVLNVRFDCNRGRGSWTSSGPGNLEFGPLALTRALCPTGSLHDELVRQWPNVRTYTVKDGRLFLSTDGSTIEFEPAP
ncbi:MAG TPA: META domain-containing protein [Steroidobacteraceae bacterium]|nr:META domain-containing protein [Steroidobacteraceae bacterium]